MAVDGSTPIGRSEVGEDHLRGVRKGKLSARLARLAAKASSMRNSEAHRTLFGRLGKAAGLTVLATATMASGPCGTCPPPTREESYTLEELVVQRDEALATTAPDGGGGEAPTRLRSIAESWDGKACPTTEQLAAIFALNRTGYQQASELIADDAEGSCTYSYSQSCPGGRPFLVEGRARVADVRAAGPAGPSALAEAWLAEALLEHASVAAFARLSLQLLSLGAPVELIRDSQRASLDELEHAETCFAMASRYSGTKHLPGPLPVQGALDDLSLASLIECNLREGCIGETLAAESMRLRAEQATEPELEAALLRIAEDETRHAELAFRILAWCREQAPELTRSIVKRVLNEGVQARGRAERATWEHVLSPLLLAVA